MEPFKVCWILLLASALALGEDMNSTTTPNMDTSSSSPDPTTTTTPPTSNGNCGVNDKLITIIRNETCNLDVADLDDHKWHRLRFKKYNNDCNPNDMITIYLGIDREIKHWNCKENVGDTTSWFARTVSVSIDSGSKWSSNMAIVLEIQSYPYMQWSYVIIRILIGVVFMMIPILVVFYFFFRRQVARNRLLLEERIAQRRYSISVISHDDPRCAYDKPPMYEEVYDEPPPCFCKAVPIIPSPDGQSNTEGVGASSNNDEEYACHCDKMPSAEPSRVVTVQQGDDTALSGQQFK